MRYPGALIFGDGGEYAILNRCHKPVRALLYRDEFAAKELVRTGKCNAPTCTGLHEVVHIPGDSFADRERDRE